MLFLNRNLLLIILLAIIIFLVPSRVLSAEVLQVQSSSIIRIGDNNRSYRVKLACISIEPLKDKEATIWLKSELPRKSRVNFFPQGYEAGTLIADLISLSSNKDIGKEMNELGFAQITCKG